MYPSRGIQRGTETFGNVRVPHARPQNRPGNARSDPLIRGCWFPGGVGIIPFNSHGQEKKRKTEIGGLCLTREVFAPEKKNGKWINSVLRTSYMTEMIGGLKFQMFVLIFTHIIGGGHEFTSKLQFIFLGSS